MKTTWNRLASLSLIIFTTCTLRASSYYLESLGGAAGPPYPFDPSYGTLSLTEIGPDKYVVEDGDSESLQSGGMRMTANSINPNDPPGTNTSNGLPTPPNIRNYAKYGAQEFSMVDTNAILNAGIDVLTNLFNAFATLPAPTNGLPWLTIKPYGANGVIIRADNFDYTQTNADFALLICDKVETPTWKAIDFSGASDAQDGWLVQGLVPNSQVTSTMFFQVTNLNISYNAFFKVVPYSGPQVAIIGTNQPYDTVKGVITLTTQIYDLSGTTNEHFVADVNGNSFAHAALSNNAVTLDTKYSPNGQDYGINNVNLTVEGFPTVYGYSTAPGNTQLIFNSAASIPLDFENVNYLLYQSAIAERSIGTNAMLWVCNKAEDITCTITDPSNNQIVASYGGHIPGPTIVEIDWNFTEADHVTPYSNTTYVVHFVASDPDDFQFPNYIVPNNEIRPAAGVFITYEQEDENDWFYGTTSVFVNQQANTWLDQTLTFFYQDIYKGDLTGYSHGEVGDWRNMVQCKPQTLNNQYWTNILQPALSSTIVWIPDHNPPEYSDLTIGGAHGTGYEIGGTAAHAWSWAWNLIRDTFTAQQLQTWLQAVGPQWRLRKAAFWVCDCNNVAVYSKEHPGPNGQTSGTSLDFISACGIRDARDQLFNHVHKNCGWFTCGNLDEIYISSIPSTDTDGKIASEADTMWACGATAYPGSCDPTYASEWVVEQMIGMYPLLSPGIHGGSAALTLFGYPYLPYTPNYDDDMAANAGSHRPPYIKFPGVP